MKKPWTFLQVFGRMVPVFKVLNLIESEAALGLYTIPDITDPKPVILIEESLKGDEFNRILIHELFHAVIHRTYLNCGMSDEIEEALVDQMATAITENFKLGLKKAA